MDAPRTAPTSTTVGISELRRNLSLYLARVKAGETLTITKRGREIARLIPSVPGGKLGRR
jgi:prevent-host-death family protein